MLYTFMLNCTDLPSFKEEVGFNIFCVSPAFAKNAKCEKLTGKIDNFGKSFARFWQRNGILFYLRKFKAKKC